MTQDIVNENQKISYTNLDFSSIYTEVIDLIKQLTYRWDPSISDESDPGVVLVKLSSLIADKCNYNIDKNILETFPLSVTQNGNARQLYDQLGYYMDWYESAIAPVTLNWIGDTQDSSVSYKIPKFTAITDSESSHTYSLVGVEGVDGIVISDIVLPADGKNVTAVAMEGTPVQYQFENETVITSQMVDPLSRRLYFPHSYVSQNGVFIKNTTQENYASWKRVNNLYENSYNELRYVFGYDSSSNTCFLEFPDNYSELFGSGIEITYLVVPQETSNIPAQTLNQFLVPISLDGVVLDSSNVKITNYLSAYGHKDVESINDAYINYKKTVGTFKTLITLRDYLNFITNRELDICSNAFVCDRTNDIQSTYRIMSNQHDLDTIIVKIEQIVDNTSIESNFDYKFIKTSDTEPGVGKTYYSIVNNTLEEIDDTTGKNPKAEDWYELESVELKTKDALSPFSLKFYLLRKAIALNNKTAYNQTFDIMNPYPDFDSLLGDTSHLEHIYEDILPLGKNTYKKSEDDEFLENKSYWLYIENEDTFELISDTETFDSSPADNANVYEIDVEALLPHTVMFKAIYPVTLNISTYNVLDEDTQMNITSNIISSLYSSVNSSEVDFGIPISIDYLIEIAKNSDDRIKSISIDPLSYSLHAIYYNDTEDTYEEVEIDDNMGTFAPNSYRDMSGIVSALIKKDIVCKSILAGTTQLLVPDKTFIYHLSQNYVDYVEDIVSITGEATIDIRNDSVTSYALNDDNSYIRKSYVLKNNEMLSLYRPKFNATKTFSNNIHFEYLLYNDIEADSTYRLGNNECIIFYNPIKDDDNSTIIGYTAYACSEGAIIHTSFGIKKQTSASALSSFARGRIIPYFTINPAEDYYELSTYNENYKVEIRNSSSIINNAISGTNEISIKELSTITLERSDKYKFFWILNEPTYSSNSNLKSYTLFDNYNSEEDSIYSDEINTYTLKNGEALFYTDEANTNFAMVGPGTTIIRNCGVESSVYSEIDNSLYYLEINEISYILNDSVFDFLTDGLTIKPFANGLYEVPDDPSGPEQLTEDSNPFALGLYEMVGEESADHYFIPTLDTTYNSSKLYYKVVFERTLDENAETSKHYYVLAMRKQPNSYIETTVIDESGNNNTVYVYDEVNTGCFKEVNLYNSYDLVNPLEEGYYEHVIYNNNRFIDTYPLNETANASDQNRFATTVDTSIINRKILSDTKYSNINLGEIGSYTSIDMNQMDTSSPTLLNLLTPIYRDYYSDSECTIRVDVDYTTDVSEFYIEENVQNTTSSPEIVSIEKTKDVELMSEVNSLYSDDISMSGYYYKPSSINSIYYYKNLSVPYLDAGVVLPEYEGLYNRSPLDYLYLLYTSTTGVDTLDPTLRLNSIASKWNTIVSYQKPYMKYDAYDAGNIYVYGDIVSYSSKTYKCIVVQSSSTWVSSEWVEINNSWAVKDFGDATPSPVANVENFIKVYGETIINKSITVNNIYPSLDTYLDTSVEPNVRKPYFYIPAEYLNNGYLISDLVGANEDNYQLEYYQFNNDFVYLDTDAKLNNLFVDNTNVLTTYGTVHIYFLPRLYKFNDFVRFTYKQYFEPKELFNRNCGEIKAWSCTALDNDYIRDNPIKNIGDLWASLQTNTSLTIIENDIESFSVGDVLIFNADEASESYVNWPIFNNTECKLDLNAYSVSYQRVGQDIKDIESLKVDDYEWRGYSSLILNTSNNNGQKLEYNHKLFLYNSESETEPVKVISGSDRPDITFQLKYPVENASGAFIDVSSVDILGENISNELYAFTSFTNGDYYTYDTNNYKTYLYFNKDNGDEPKGPNTISIPVGLPPGEYLLGINMKDDVNLTVTYDSTNLCSYVDESRTVFTGDKYDYIKLTVEAPQDPNNAPQLYLEFTIDNENDPLTYTILDVFKYENNPSLGDSFDEIRAKIKALDVDEEFNYTFIPKDNDLIENPLESKMFWNSNHIFNSYVIPQMNFDELNFRYVTTKINR